MESSSTWRIDKRGQIVGVPTGTKSAKNYTGQKLFEVGTGLGHDRRIAMTCHALAHVSLKRLGLTNALDGHFSGPRMNIKPLKKSMQLTQTVRVVALHLRWAVIRPDETSEITDDELDAEVKRIVSMYQKSIKPDPVEDTTNERANNPDDVAGATADSRDTVSADQETQSPE